MVKLSGWGRFPVVDANVHAPSNQAALRELICSEPNLIARGNGRAYGDSAVNSNATVQSRHLNRILSFDPQTGLLVAEAGVLIGDIIDVFLARGWFPLVTPGTKYVSLGGCIAADVHGKNHHKDGSFRSCVEWVEIMGAAGTIERCSRRENPFLFDHTLGGMGLTGVITLAAIRLRQVETAWICKTTHSAPNLKAAMEVFETNKDAPYSVAWIDCLAKGANLGRSLIMLGEHATCNDLLEGQRQNPFDIPRKLKRKLPFSFPKLALNNYSLRAFNALYFWAGRRKTGRELVDWDSFFYPLDSLLEWNRIYGRDGFVQFQCVLPLDTSEAGLSALLAATSDAGLGSFLAVLKRFGPQDSAFSFPMEGYTLALDFPLSPRTLRLLEALDAITLDHGGRFYLAKDSRMSADVFNVSDKRVAAFQQHRLNGNWRKKFRSAQSERLSI